MKNYRSLTGAFTLAELLIVIAILMVVFSVVVALGWGVAFAFSATVLIPALHVPAHWSNLASIVASIALTGVGTFLVVAILALLGGAIGLLAKGKR